LCETGEFDASLRLFARQIAVTPELPELHQLLGTMFLQYGFLAEGWAHYRQRPAFQVFHDKLPGITLARTLPENLDGMHLCALDISMDATPILALTRTQHAHKTS